MKTSDATTEETRIKLAYQRRSKPTGYYSLFDPGVLFIMQERERILLKRLKEQGCDPLTDSRFLEIGCGSGHWLQQFIRWGVSPANITGIDLRPDVLSEAARLCPQEVTLKCMGGGKLEFQNETFDLVLQSMAFTSVLDEEMRYVMAQEMLRVVKKNGLIVWYDFFFANPWNPDVRGIGKAEIYRLFPICDIELERVSLILPLAKSLAPWSWGACYFLSRLRLLNTFYLGVIKR